MKKWYLVVPVLTVILLAISCGPKEVPEAAISEIYALSESEAFGKDVEVKDVQDREGSSYIMLYVKSPPGEFTTLEDALAQAKGFTGTFLESAVQILKGHDINQDVSVWVQLPLEAGGVTVLGHADYEDEAFHDFELYMP